jgi:H+/Cl- antiporter ClcA
VNRPRVTDTGSTTERRLLRPRLLRYWLHWRRQIVFWLGAVATGAVAVALARSSDAAQVLWRDMAARSAIWRWCAPPLALAAVTWITQRWFAGAQGSGIPQTIAALSVRDPAARDRLLSLRLAGGKLLLTVVALAGGASIGREGPTVQIGASIMHSLRRLVRFSAADVDRGLILAGGAAGVAAAFNTPLAGIVFALEELSRSFEERTSGTILTAVILSGVTSIALVGNYTYFGTTQAVMGEPRTWLAIPLCGVAGGLGGGIFARVMIAMAAGLPGRLRALPTRAPIRFALACGVALALLGWLSGGTTFGTGYAQARGIIQGDALPPPGFALLKFLATVISYIAGIPGGIFAPSLAVGAALGGELSPWLHFAPAGAVVVLTMAAYFAGVVQAPLTALVIVTEMTGGSGLTLPLMAVVLIGRGVSATVYRQSLYRTLARPFAQAPPPAPG